MRIQETIQTLEQALPLLATPGSSITKNGINYVSAINLTSLREAIRMLNDTDMFVLEIERILQSDIFMISADSALMDPDKFKFLAENVTILHRVVKIVLEALKSAMPAPRDNSVFIKLPEVQDFSDLAKTAEAFQKILSQSILEKEIGGEIKIEAVENGSIWLEVFVNSAAAVALIGSIAWSAMVIRKKKIEGDIAMEVLKAKRIQNSNKEDMSNAYKQVLDFTVELEASQIQSEHFKNNDPERINRLKMTLKLLSEEIAKGAEIHPSLTAPEQVKNLFPTSMALVHSRVKEIDNE